MRLAFAFLLCGAVVLPLQANVWRVRRAFFLGFLDLYIAACVARAIGLFLVHNCRPQ